MKALKTVLALVFGIVIFGNLIMLGKGEFTSGWNFFALLIFIVIEIYLISSINKESDPGTNISTKSENQNKEGYLKKDVQQSITNYQDSANHFQFLSDETLLSKYENNETSRLTEMEKLALEEELVKRKLIKYSAAHEKLDKISELF
jgi:hypothetical protein